MRPIRVGILGYDGVQALDIIGPGDAFTIATGDPESRKCYEVLVIGSDGRPFTAESGVVFHPHESLRTAPVLDTLIIPGGKGLRISQTNDVFSRWITNRASRIRRIACVCTGAYGLASTGLLDGRRVTTHWRFARDLALRFPKLKVDANALFLKDGPFYTSAGVTAGIDLSLALIEEDFGPRLALAVARELVVYMKRTGGQEQYSEPLQFQTNSTDQFDELASWMLRHLEHDLSLEVLARRACLSPRHFSRRFKSVFGATPAAFVEHLRLDEARRRLIERRQTIESVATSVGFHSDDSFRRAFERRFGVKPSSYRKGFNLRPDNHAARSRPRQVLA
jgi:transcriptional regulator GlxA family with amidase domain